MRVYSISNLILVAIWTALILHLSGCEREIKRDFFADRTLKSEVEIRNGEYDGIYKEYFQSGKIRKEIEYKTGLMDGRYVEYFESGRPRYIASFVKGRFKGNDVLKFEDGRINEITSYDEFGRPQDFINFRYRGGRSDHRALIFFNARMYDRSKPGDLDTLFVKLGNADSSVFDFGRLIMLKTTATGPDETDTVQVIEGSNKDFFRFPFVTANVDSMVIYGHLVLAVLNAGDSTQTYKFRYNITIDR